VTYHDEHLEHVEAAFDVFLAHAQEVCPDLRVQLRLDPKAGMHGGQSCARAYAYCVASPRRTPVARRPGKRAGAHADSYIVAVAPKIAHADEGRLEALLCHELAHAILLHLGDDEHTERDADECAERVFRIRIYYDADDVQTTDAFAPKARRPRPLYLDDEHGRTRTT
jgi:hypothetical protein